MTTARLHLSRVWSRDPTLLILAMTMLIVGPAILIALARQHSRPAGQAPTPAPIIIIATSQPYRVAGVHAPGAAGLARAVVAYAAPGGAVLGALEAGRPVAIVARSGDGWLLVEAEGSGQVWVRAADLLGVAATLPDLATPTTTPVPVVVVAAPPSLPVAQPDDPGPMVKYAGPVEMPRPERGGR